MLLATSLGEHAFYVLLAAFTLLWLAIKAIAIVDDDGEVKKRANEGLAEWIRRWLN